MRSLLLAAILVSWACAEGVAPPRQFDQAADASADTTGEEAATLVQAPEEQEQEEQEEQAKAFSYEEWTAEPPTRGEPKIPGYPFPYLEAGGKKELYDRIRRLRWFVWLFERIVLAEEAWIENWEVWIEDGHLATAVAQPDAARFCRNDGPPARLRANDQSLSDILDERSAAMHLVNTWGSHFTYSDEETLLRSQINVLETGIATYFFKLIELRKNILQDRGAYSWRMKAVDEKIQKAYGCEHSSTFNACWLGFPSYTVSLLKQPRCADQR